MVFLSPPIGVQRCQQRCNYRLHVRCWTVIKVTAKNEAVTRTYIRHRAYSIKHQVSKRKHILIATEYCWLLANAGSIKCIWNYSDTYSSSIKSILEILLLLTLVFVPIYSWSSSLLKWKWKAMDWLSPHFHNWGSTRLKGDIFHNSFVVESTICHKNLPLNLCTRVTPVYPKSMKSK